MPCLAPKTTATLPALEGVVAILVDPTTFRISWDTATSYPDQDVRFTYRKDGGSSMQEELVVARDTGSVDTTVPVELGNVYLYWLRVETATEKSEFSLGSYLFSIPTMDFSEPYNSMYTGVV